MKKLKTIFYVFLGIYLIASLIITFQINEVFDRFGILRFMDFIFYWIIIGLILFAVEIIIENIHIQRLTMKIRSLEKNKNNLKAKLFDIDQEHKDTDASLRSFGKSIGEGEEDPGK